MGRRPQQLLLFAAAGLAAGAMGWWDLTRPREAHYGGRPASWWAAEYGDSVVCVAEPDDPDDERPCLDTWVRSWVHRPPFWERVGAEWGLSAPARIRGADTSLLDGDPEAVPVLLALLGRPEPPARMAAVVGLGRVGPGHAGARRALEGALGDPDPDVRLLARAGLDGVAAPAPPP